MKLSIKKHLLLFLIVTYQMMPLFGMQAKKIVEKGPIDWALNNVFLIMGFLVIAGAVWSMLSTFETVVEYEKKKMMKAQGIPIPESIQNTQPVVAGASDEPSFLKNLYDRAWQLVPQEKEHDILLDHNYDGIRELDNNLPPWWVAMFWGCIAIGVAYYSYYHIFDYGESSREAYAIEVAYAEDQVAAFLARQPDQVDENKVAFLNEEDALTFGNTIYVANCASCHGQSGEGGIGPNLTDPYWLHGGSITNIFKTIKYGVPAKGMIAWKSQLRSSDIQKVSSYIMTLQGSNPANAKEAQGELYEPKETAPKSIGMK